MAGELTPLVLASSAGLMGHSPAAGLDLPEGCPSVAAEQYNINHGD
jgi:hypothetical protein